MFVWAKALLLGLGLDKLYNAAVKAFINATEAGYVPDFIVRRGMRFLLAARANAQAAMAPAQRLEWVMKFVQELKSMPIALNTDEANQQHYEVPTPYFLLVLGKHLKYSSCLYSSPSDSLDQAEVNMLLLYCERAKLADGQRVLEMGCGWGSFSLFAAARYPRSAFTAVSNSATQKEFIDGEARKRGITNLKVITANMVSFQGEEGAYDRVVSIEMLEHMKNYEALLARVGRWLAPGGLLFVHIFVHTTHPYHFEVNNEEDWMSKYFFTGGTMPSLDLLLYFQDSLAIRNHWYVSGQHYSRTLEAWLVKHDRRRREVMAILREAYKGSPDGPVVWFNRWRMFYMACSELFNFSGGNEWGVGHYLFEKKAAAAAVANGSA